MLSNYLNNDWRAYLRKGQYSLFNVVEMALAVMGIFENGLLQCVLLVVGVAIPLYREVKRKRALALKEQPHQQATSQAARNQIKKGINKIIPMYPNSLLVLPKVQTELYKIVQFCVHNYTKQLFKNWIFLL